MLLGSVILPLASQKSSWYTNPKMKLDMILESIQNNLHVTFVLPFALSLSLHKDLNFKFQMNHSNHLDVGSNFVCCNCLRPYYRLKRVFSDSNNIFLWHESEDINKKACFQNLSWLIPILRFQVMHDYVCFIAPIDYCVE